MKNFLMRGLLASALGGAVLFGPAHAQTSEAPLGASLHELLSYAREHNPELAARRLEAAANRERIEPAGALPDPKFQLELMDFTNTMSGGGASLVPGAVGQTRYRVIQSVPFWGKRGLRGGVAEALADQSARFADSAVLEVEARIKTAYVRYYQADGQSAIIGETLALLDALSRLVETRYSVGLVPQQDAIRAHSELTTLKIERVEAERRRRDAVAKLNAQLPRRADAPLDAPTRLPEAPAQLDLAALFERAKSLSPGLARERLGTEAAAKSRELVYLNRYPDFGVALTNNRPQNGTDSWDVMLEVNIPLQQRSRRAQEREAERRVDAAHSQVAAAEARLNGQLGEAHAAFEANVDKARLLRGTLLPQARANFDAAMAGYESGRVNFNTLIEAERQILRARLALLDADAEIHIRLAELELLVGAPL
ncbi:MULTISPECIES: TolC family protein [Denitromonas]|uniref:TolC family protein n=3 Tax=Denitromonas TaxID=139331 RepID=A0A944HCT3_DENI1|nr:MULTISPECIES: TolC family protein [Denitromonas]TVT48730.1 MAG: TolC family protein [Denitromonas halophila]MBT0963037.1 TolC family protein [Denitromonas iodatirespirans]TVO59590.1 TolC family protein [Denitromonas ohlonensis]TVO71415.1 TolC family protein [Denitromonas ohlonensis]TVT68889.1 MAG: TolC family protein [Denitromonas halophila]